MSAVRDREDDEATPRTWGDTALPDAAPSRLAFPDVPRLRLDELLVQLVDRAREVIGTADRDAGRATTDDATNPAERVPAELPRLEELLVQLVERSEEVIGTQGRLRGLLRAIQLVTGDLELPVLLGRIVEAARELTGAGYAALGVLAPTGGLAEFVNTGLPEGAAEQIGHLPEGKGLLGALIDDPRPIRLRRLADDPRAAGFPPGHPPMASFLGVPIRVRGEVFGNLYLTESDRGEFSAEDEELVTVLAAAAGVAVTQARLYQAARARGEWMQASVAVTRELLAAEPGPGAQPLRLIAERSRDIAAADVVLLLLRPDSQLDTPGSLVVEVAVGAHADRLIGWRLPIGGTLAGEVFTARQAQRVAQLQHPAGLSDMLSGEVEIGPMLAVPLLGSGRVHGVLCVARTLGRAAFTAEDLDMACGFANHAAVAIELAVARADQQRAVLLDDRERIAADLHDHVIQRLFAAGLSLQAMTGVLGRGPMADRLMATIKGLDDTILQIRSSIFQLQQEPRSADTGVRARLLGVLTEVAPALGFEPSLRFSGLLEGVLPDSVVEDLLAVLREALTNIARHAGDGRGIGATTRRSGLANLRRRAHEHGGTLVVEPRQPSGTRLTWTVPLR